MNVHARKTRQSCPYELTDLRDCLTCFPDKGFYYGSMIILFIGVGHAFFCPCATDTRSKKVVVKTSRSIGSLERGERCL